MPQWYGTADSTGEVHPAGMFYYHIQNPMLDYEEESDPVLRILKELALNGIVNAVRRL